MAPKAAAANLRPLERFGAGPAEKTCTENPMLWITFLVVEGEKLIIRMRRSSLGASAPHSLWTAAHIRDRPETLAPGALRSRTS